MEKQKRGFAILLASVPILSFLLQLIFSYFSGDLKLLLRHYTVTYVDFLFVPLNFFILKAINWQKGKHILVIFLAAFILSCVVHYGWAVNGTDPGHMIQANGFVKPAGWVHIIFSAFQFCLMLLFIFDYQPPTKNVLFLSTLFLQLYFIGSLISGYFIHNMLLAEDVVRVVIACLVFALYYVIRRRGLIRLNVRQA